MGVQLHVLIVEDSRSDAEFLLLELERGGYEPAFERVDTPEAMSTALDEHCWDIIVSDYVMPRFDGLAALKLVQEKGIDIPFIITSGKIGEEVAAEAMKAGANDYVLKGNSARLIPAIQRELREVAIRRQRREAEEALRRAHEELRQAHAQLELHVEERTAQLAAVNEELRRRQDELQSHSRRAELLASAVMELSAGADVTQVVETILRRTADLLGGEGMSLYLFDEDGQNIREAFALRDEDRDQLVVDIDDLPCAKRAVLSNKPVYFTLQEAEGAEGGWLESRGVNGAMVLPLLIKDRRVGVIFVNFLTVGQAPTDEDLAFAQTVARECAQAVDRVRARAAAEEGKRLLEALMEHIPEGITIVDANGRLQMASKYALQASGMTQENIGNVDPSAKPQLWPVLRADGATPAPVEEWAISRALNSGERVTDQEMVIQRPDGQKIPILANAAPIRDVEGKLVGAVNVWRDVTDRRRAEQEREALLEQLRTVNEKLTLSSIKVREQAEETERRAAELEAAISSIPDGLVIHDQVGRIVRMNALAERILGFSPEERERSIAQRVGVMTIRTPDGKPLTPDHLPVARALCGETIQNEVMSFHRQGQPIRWVSVSVAPIRTVSGEVTGAISTMADITAQRDLEKLREDFIHMVSHDLRSPLTAIRGHAQLLQMNLAKGGMERELKSAEAIVMGTRRMNAMIQDLVDSTRLESGQLHLDKEPIGLGYFAADLLERASDTLDSRRVKIEIEPHLSPVSADANRLERILINLLSNALKYSPAETEVLVQAQAMAGETLVSVSDKGVGIAAEELPHIFGRFYRSQRTHASEGLGLGLYITRMLVEAHGGRIWAESSVGQGSTFYITLPAA